MSVALAFLALLIEAFVGYPDRLVRAIGHPVIWIGRLIGFLDCTLNRNHSSYASPTPAPMQRFRLLRDRVKPGNDDLIGSASRIPGVLALMILLGAVAAATLVERSLLLLPFGLVALALVASTLIAQRSLHDHVARVAAALETGGVEAGRTAVAQIVGREVASLDEAGVARAAIESLAENFSDGVVAPTFWLAVGGLPGAALYKAINTADSMIGHRTPRHQHFGWAAARLDDLVNLPASRLSALLMVAAAVMTPKAAPSLAWRAVRRDAARHRSPNAGYPEAAMAGALSLALGGPRVYTGDPVDDAWMGEGGRREATAADIRAALALYRRADVLLITLLAILAALVSPLAASRT
jgi:adenosylcobinamide-phosphate synthase